MHEFRLKIQETFVLEDIFLVLVGYEGQYIRFAKTYNPGTEQERLAEPRFLIFLGLDLSFKELTTTIPKFVTYYEANGKFIESQSRAERGLVNHALSAAVRRITHEHLVLVGQLKTQFLTSSDFTLPVLNLHIIPSSRITLQFYTLEHEILKLHSLLGAIGDDEDLEDVDNILRSLQEGGGIR